ncbi:Aste57867_17134 [Aphanomyces stellatus]|uniref:Aste57867_17134 protein n=1 Tax=Aphanomyces stellatus TaxID=120398 RepID=A0A485LAH2_9STRA|nr:hypothetical protein As57867_017075 [Aphanomyces stellatus]VFT93892.1 Aste57867_17134 [Aphanomyces stellatus]
MASLLRPTSWTFDPQIFHTKTFAVFLAEKSGLNRMLVLWNRMDNIDFDDLLLSTGGQSSVRAIQVVNMSSTTLPSLVRQSMANPNDTVVTKQIVSRGVALFTAYDHNMALVPAFHPLFGPSWITWAWRPLFVQSETTERAPKLGFVC